MAPKISTEPHSIAPRLLYDRRESARQLSVSIRSLDYLIANKQLSFRRLGKKVLIPHSELVRYSRGDHFGPVKGPRE
jgi:excisionase family DNA binding protein